ncbi:MAG: zf-TFIIB domain-containing protein [Cyanobacteria bacterium P01_D01_bin.14]
MRCPVCQDTPLNRNSLEEYLAVNSCTSCSGHWISSYDYWHWLEWRINPPSKPQSTLNPTPEAAMIDLSDRLPGLGEVVDTDNRRAIFCPDCQHLMRKAKVGHGLEFYLDRCSHCGGVWCDANELELLQAHGLETKVHLIFSEQWQAQIRQDEFKKVLQQTYRSNLGDDDYDRAIAIKEWINSHPNKGYLLSLLNQECLTEAKEPESAAGQPQQLSVMPYESPTPEDGLQPEPALANGNGNHAYANQSPDN